MTKAKKGSKHTVKIAEILGVSAIWLAEGKGTPETSSDTGSPIDHGGTDAVFFTKPTAIEPPTKTAARLAEKVKAAAKAGKLTSRQLEILEGTLMEFTREE